MKKLYLGYWGLGLLYLIAICIKISFLQTPNTQQYTLKLSLNNSPNRAWGVNYKITEKDIECMALNIYFEARGEPLIGQYAVGEVVMYRTMHDYFPNTICEVIKDGVYYNWNTTMPVKHLCAFSWYCDRKSDKPTNKQQYKKSLKIAKEILTNPSYNNKINYSLFYHANTVEPAWSKNMKLVDVVYKHYFYNFN